MALIDALPLLRGAVPIETDDALLRARRTAAFTRLAVGVMGLALLLGQPRLLPHLVLGGVGFAVILATALVQLSAPRLSWLSVEEALSAAAGLLITGLATEHVTVLSLLWLVAVASGVLARGGRVHWLGRNIVLAGLALPVIRYGRIDGEYAAFLIGAISLLLTSGRLTGELNLLLGQARLQAEKAETLLYAGDIAARMGERSERTASVGVASGVSARERGMVLRAIGGEGLSMAVQPIVDIRDWSVHAYEALARFNQKGMEGSPLPWFSVAERIGERSALERACLQMALELFAMRPAGTSLSVNLSAPVLLEDVTMCMLERAGAQGQRNLEGLIIEITEETLVRGAAELHDAIAPLRARGATLAVDDMGAGYSGLRQITTVHPRYLKLDRSLITGIDSDSERAALVGALAGYSRQVGCLLIAEGVEHEAELLALAGLGVPLVQGFYLSRPGAPWPGLDPLARSAVGIGPAGEIRAGELRAQEPFALVTPDRA
jgi:EAL domain-containing protein (putative c-di-GMP-specific phosphodiesterase class I)